jgi:hypothetical protein
VIGLTGHAAVTFFALVYAALALRTAWLQWRPTHHDATLQYAMILVIVLPLTIAAGALLWRDVRAFRRRPGLPLRVLLGSRILLAGLGVVAALPPCALVVVDWV